MIEDLIEQIKNHESIQIEANKKIEEFKKFDSLVKEKVDEYFIINTIAIKKVIKIIEKIIYENQLALKKIQDELKLYKESILEDFLSKNNKNKIRSSL